MSELFFTATRVFSLEALTETLAEVRPDIIVSEYACQHFTGLDVLRVARDHDSHVPLIITTARSNEEFAALCVSKGAIDYVPREEILELGRSVLRALNIKVALEETYSARLRKTARTTGRLESIVQKVPVFVLNVSPTGDIISINRTRSPGLRVDDVAGTSIFDYLDDEHHGAVKAGLERTLRTGRETTFEVTGHDSRGDEALCFEMNISYNRDSGSAEPLVLICTDITDLKRTQSSLYQANRLSQVGMIAAGVAHDINNSLSGVYSSLDMALAEIGSDGTAPNGGSESIAGVEDRVRDAMRSAQHIGDVIRNLREYYGPSDNRAELVDLNDEVEVALKMTQGEFKHRAEIERRFGDIPRIRANRVHVRQVLINLILNAWHAVESLPPERRWISVRTWVDGKRVFAEVADRGDGIPPEHLQKVFDPFFSTKAGGAGSGLGLSICKRISEIHGGSISADSVVGEGSRFVLELPAAR